MTDEWVGCEGIGREGERFEGRVEIGDAVLCEEVDEVETSEGILARRRRKH